MQQIFLESGITHTLETIVNVDAGIQNGDVSASMFGGSSAWTTDTDVSTSYISSSNYMPSYIPMNLPKTGY